MKWTLVDKELEIEGSNEYGAKLIRLMSRIRWLTAQRLDKVAEVVDREYNDQMNSRGKDDGERKRW